MDMTRGEFLRSLAVGAGGTVTGLAALGSETAQPTNADATHERARNLAVELTKNLFEKHLNSTFRILDKASPTIVDVQLTEVREGRSTDECEQFSLLFKGPAEPLLTQKMYEVENSRMGHFDLFLVPVAANENGADYEAVFTRLRK